VVAQSGPVPLPPGRGPEQAAARLVAAAFMEDPALAFALPDEDRRQRLLPVLVRVHLRLTRRLGGAVDAIGDPPAGIAMWRPPAVRDAPVGAVLWAGLAPLAIRLGRTARRRFAQTLAVSRELRALAGADAAWTLEGLAVDPGAQGTGLGGRLLAHGLDRAASASAPCYLDTSLERNVGFYADRGFHVVGSRRVGEEGPTMWAMVRAADR
jgi:GNAT superfamily N-acetyltransferase